jgi:hypothetical protein
MDQSKEESITTLPKLIEDKIIDYQITQRIESVKYQANSVIDEMYEKLTSLAEKIYRDQNYCLEMCYGYDIIEGIKVYCMDIDLIYRDHICRRNNYRCDILYACSNCCYRQSYCSEHVKDKFFILNNEDTIYHDKLYCINCKESMTDVILHPFD